MINCITPLFSYQLDGVNRLEHVKVGALFMEQGTGKTRTALELISRRMLSGKINRVLWLCPCTVKDNLRNDIIKHCGSFPDSILIVGIESLSASAKEIQRCCAYVNEQTYLIVDESLLVKNPKALRTKRIIQLANKAKYKLILNGTPISRTEADLFSQFYILDKRIFGYESYWSFAANHLEIDETGRIVRALNTDYLVKKMKPFVFQVKKSDVMS
ncbi:MAG: SNF2-related protein, partial [Huintestinicola sp.]